MKGYMREILPMGPYTVSLELPPGRCGQRRCGCWRRASAATTRNEAGRLVVEVPRISVHEVIAVDLA